LTDGADGDVHVAAHLSLLHVGVADLAVDEDLAEGGEVGEGLLGRGDVGLGDDLHERGAGAVEVDAAGALEVEALGDVLLKVDAGETDDLAGGGDALLGVFGIGCVVQRDTAAEAERLVILRDLVVLRHVRVVVVLPVELADLGDVAAEHHPRTGGQSQGLAVHHRQGAGETEAGGAGVGVGLGSILDLAAAEHLAPGLELGVDFQADCGHVFGAHGVVLGEAGDLGGLFLP